MQSFSHNFLFLLQIGELTLGGMSIKCASCWFMPFFRRDAIFVRFLFGCRSCFAFYYHNNENSNECVWEIIQTHCSECRSASFRTWPIRHSSSNRRNFVIFSRFKIFSSSDWDLPGLCAPSLMTVRVEFWARSSNLQIWVVSRLFVERFNSIYNCQFVNLD